MTENMTMDNSNDEYYIDESIFDQAEIEFNELLYYMYTYNPEDWIVEFLAYIENNIEDENSSST